MTTYDFSPEARDRQNAKLAGIARWSENNAQHPFVDPYEPELRPSDSLSNAGVQSPPPYYAQPHGGFHPQAYPQPQGPYLQPQTYYPQPAYPGYYPMAQPMASPTYTTPYAASSRKRSRRHGHHHTSGSRSHHASPSTAETSLQSSGDLGTRYVPTVSMHSGSTMTRSYSTPPHSAGSYFVPYSGGHPAQQRQLAQPAQIVYPTSAAPVLTPYGYTTAATGTLSPYGPSAHTHHSSPRSHSHHSSHSRSRSISRSHSMMHSPVPVPAHTSQTLVLPYGNGGHVVFPPPGATVIAPQHQLRPEGNSFFGSFKSFSLKSSSRRLKRRSSQSSY
ncbi:hypothetical protein BJ912DRAFT_704907 [Pholiota molesta]|nr:hypothetical protein BJ912DRAFT_704907 [Pholiota molesta]